MKKNLKNISVISLTILLITSNYAYAFGDKKVDLSTVPPVGTSPVLSSNSNKCDTLLDKCEILRQKQKELIKEQDDMIQFQRDALKDARANKTPIWENPIFWGIVGAGLGAYLVKGK